jgi:hypothetical protein
MVTEAPPVERTAQPIVLTFTFNKAEITASTMQRLWDAAPALKAAKPDEIRIYGYTDSRGPKAYNQALSERRARAVAGQLVKLGVTAPTIEIVGKGADDRATASPLSPQARHEERRVEITWGPVDSAMAGPSPQVLTLADATVRTGLTSTKDDTTIFASVKTRNPRLELTKSDGMSAAAGFGIKSPWAVLQGGGHTGLIPGLDQSLVVKPHDVALVFPSHRPLPSALSQSKAGSSRPHPTSCRIMTMDRGDKAVSSVTFLWQSAPLTRRQTIQAPIPHRPADQPQGWEADRGGHPPHLAVPALA